MEYKYYTAIVFETLEGAFAFSRSYRYNPTYGDENTKYQFPVTETEEGSPCTVIYNLNDLTEEDLVRVQIEKVSTDFKTE